MLADRTGVNAYCITGLVQQDILQQLIGNRPCVQRNHLPTANDTATNAGARCPQKR